MKRTISDNEFYQVKVDTTKNRMYLTLKGVWRAPKETPNYVADVIKGARMLSGKFTLLSNFSMLLPFQPTVWEEVHYPALQALFQNGVGRAAQILPRNEDTTALLEEKAKVSGIELMAFGDEEIAERFLDG